jgi:hypothetical protein
MEIARGAARVVRGAADSRAKRPTSSWFQNDGIDDFENRIRDQIRNRLVAARTPQDGGFASGPAEDCPSGFVSSVLGVMEARRGVVGRGPQRAERVAEPTGRFLHTRRNAPQRGRQAIADAQAQRAAARRAEENEAVTPGRALGADGVGVTPGGMNSQWGMPGQQIPHIDPFTAAWVSAVSGMPAFVPPFHASGGGPYPMPGLMPPTAYGGYTPMGMMGVSVPPVSAMMAPPQMSRPAFSTQESSFVIPPRDHSADSSPSMSLPEFARTPASGGVVQSAPSTPGVLDDDYQDDDFDTGSRDFSRASSARLQDSPTPPPPQRRRRSPAPAERQGYDFGKEESRVRSKVDSFYPRPGMSRADVDGQIQKAQQSEEESKFQAKMQARHIAEAAERRHTRKEHRAAVQIQAMARGFLARERVAGLWAAFTAAYERASAGGGAIQRIVDPTTKIVYLLDTETGVYEEAGVAPAAAVPVPRAGMGRTTERRQAPSMDEPVDLLGASAGRSPPAVRDSFAGSVTLTAQLSPIDRRRHDKLEPIPGASEAQLRAAAAMDQVPMSPIEPPPRGSLRHSTGLNAMSVPRTREGTLDLPEAPLPLDSVVSLAAGAQAGEVIDWAGKSPLGATAPARVESSSEAERQPPGPVPFSSTLRRPVAVAWGTPAADSEPAQGPERWDESQFETRSEAEGGSVEEEEDALSVASRDADDAAEAIRLFLPDGSRKRTLRSVVSRALKASKFDSVSALLVSEAGREAAKRPKKLPGQQQGRMTVESLGIRLPKGAVSPKPKPHKTGGKLSRSAKATPVKGAAAREASQVEEVKDDAELFALGRKRGEAPAVRLISETGTTDELRETAKGIAQALSPERKSPERILPAQGPPVELPPKRRQEMCFACWAMGHGAHCSIHREADERPRMLPGLESEKSVMACANWSAEALARQFRDEAIHEVFSRTSASLRFDSLRQAFHTVAESRHPLYRALADGVAYYNERKRRLRRRRRWFQSLMEEVKTGLWTKGYKGGSTQSRILRLRGTLANVRWVRKFHWMAAHRFPLPPLTGVLPVHPDNRVTDGVLSARWESKNHHERAEELRELMEQTPRGSERRDVESYAPIVIARARGNRKTKARGAGKGLYAPVATLPWDASAPAGESKKVQEATALLPTDAFDELFTLQQSHTVRDELRGMKGEDTDDPLKARPAARKRAQQYARFWTDSENMRDPILWSRMVGDHTTTLRSMRREGVVYDDVTAESAAPTMGVTIRPQENKRSGARQRTPKNDAPQQFGAEKEFDVDTAARPEDLVGPSHESLGHADHPGMKWKLLVTLPAPDPATLQRPLVYYPYEPRHVPVPVPKGSALKAAVDQHLEYEANRGARKVRSEAEATCIVQRLSVREGSLSAPQGAAAVTGSEESIPDHLRDVVIHGDTQAALASRIEPLTASEHELHESLPEVPPLLQLREDAEHQPHVGMLDPTVMPSYTHFRRPPPAHDLRCTFYRLTAGREYVFGGLPAQTNLVAWVTTAMPPAFGGMMALRPSSVVPLRVPDVIHMAVPGGDVDVRDIVPLAGDEQAAGRYSEEEARVLAWKAALGDEAASAMSGIAAVSMEPVNEGRVRAALGVVRFGGATEAAVWQARAVARRDAVMGRREAASAAEEAREQAMALATRADLLREHDPELAGMLDDEAGKRNADAEHARAQQRFAEEGIQGPLEAAQEAAERAKREAESIPPLRGFVVFDSVDVPASAPTYTLAPLVSPLNDRVPPTITLSTVAEYHAAMARTVRADGAIPDEDAEDNPGTDERPVVGESGTSGSEDVPRHVVPSHGFTGALGMPRPDLEHPHGRGKLIFEGHVAHGGAGIRVFVLDHDAPLYYGDNRLEQTGEAFYVGFRTAEAVVGMVASNEMDATAFTPHDEVVAPNETSPIVGTTTHADRFYPFAVPSTTPNSAADLLYILLTSRPSPNEPCSFVVLGHQDGGEYLGKCDFLGNMGPLSMHVYRSLAAAQAGEIEEFRTATGVPYWYNRRTGETYWEPPLPEVPDEVQLEEEEGRSLRELLERERSSAQLPGKRRVVRLPDNLYERREDGSLIHSRLLAEDGSLRPDALEILEAEQVERDRQERRAMLLDYEKNRKLHEGLTGAPESVTHLADAGAAIAGQPPGKGLVLPQSEFLPDGWRKAGRATAGGFARGAAAEALAGAASKGARPATSGATNVPARAASDVITAGPYTQHRMRQYMLAPRRTDDFLQGASQSVMPNRLAEDAPAVGYVQQPREQQEARGRAPGADVVAVGQRYAVQLGPAPASWAASAAVADPDGLAAGAGIGREEGVRREQHRASLAEQAAKLADEAGRRETVAAAAAAGATMVAPLGPKTGAPSRLPAPLPTVVSGLGAAQIAQSGAVAIPPSLTPSLVLGGSAGPNMAALSSPAAALSTDLLVSRITSALSSVLPQLQASGAGGTEQMLQLGLGLGLGLGIGQNGGTPAPSSTLMPPALNPSLPEYGFSQEMFSPMGGGTRRPMTSASSDRMVDHFPLPHQERPITSQSIEEEDEEGVRMEEFSSGLPALAPEAGFPGAAQNPPRQSLPPDETSGPNARPRADMIGAPSYRTHPTPGASRGEYMPAGSFGALVHDDPDRPLQAVKPRLATGFVDQVYTPSTAPQRAAYMPQSSNSNKSRVLGVVAPRQIIEDWAAVGFDPWSAGKRLRTTVLVREIGTLEEPSGAVSADGGLTAAGGEEDPVLKGIPGGVLGPSKLSVTQQLVMSGEMRSKAASDERAQEQMVLEQMFSYTRNNRYDALEALMAAKHMGAADVDIDARDELGNTLLHVASQNGNKRVVKLALRRGANINLRNNGGNTPLHYAYAYGFEELGEYLKAKGADDTLQNLEGLTPYEGLSAADLDAL